MEDVERFLNPDYERDTHSPFLLQGMDRAVERLFAAIAKKEHVVVYADFDCDGIPGAALLWDFFKKVGYEHFEIYIPHRDREGYGFHKEAIEELSKQGVSLIITVDVGTNALDAIAFAKEKGVDVIVTDHHEVTGVLSEAVATLNPKLGEYPFRELCGAAVAFKFVQAMLIEGKKRNLAAFSKVPEGWEKWLLDLVAIATVADLVPLVGENRALTHFGLKVLRKSSRVGLVALTNRLRLRRENLSESDIAFSFAPRINAASRMDEPEFALRLLITTDHLEAERIAAHLEELNAKRKVAVASIVKVAKRTVRTRFTPEDRVVVLGSPEWKPALLGLAANSIMEDRGGVVCMWGRDAEGRIKGSCRSDGSLSVVDLFSGARDSFIEFGGHAKSGGFSVSHEQVHLLPAILNAVAQNLLATGPDSKNVAEEISIHDGLMSIPQLNEAFFAEVSRLAPFGIGNPKPVFLVSSITVSSVRRFGRDSNHVEVVVSCDRTGVLTRAFDFFNSPEGFSHTPVQGSAARLLATLERDSFRGGLTLRLMDVVPI